MKSRRELIGLSAGLVVSTAGCMSLGSNQTTTETETEIPDSDYDGVPDKNDDYATQALLSEQKLKVEEELTLKPTAYEVFPISLERDGLLRYDIVSKGGPIDVLVSDRENYDKWQKDKESAKYLVVYSSLNTASAEMEMFLDKGSYVVIVDHTKAKTPPNSNKVEVDFSMEVALQSPDQETVAD